MGARKEGRDKEDKAGWKIGLQNDRKGKGRGEEERKEEEIERKREVHLTDIDGSEELHVQNREVLHLYTSRKRYHTPRYGDISMIWMKN